jgi:hypothetical protein
VGLAGETRQIGEHCVGLKKITGGGKPHRTLEKLPDMMHFGNQHNLVHLWLVSPDHLALQLHPCTFVDAQPTCAFILTARR